MHDNMYEYIHFVSEINVEQYFYDNIYFLKQTVSATKGRAAIFDAVGEMKGSL